MTERKRHILMGIGLIGALVYALNYYLPKLTADDKGASATPNVETSATPQATVAKIASTINQIDIEKERSEPWGSDPFRSRKPQAMPTMSIEVPASQWNLSGIVLGGELPMAIINSRGVSEGDEIDGARVISIQSREVVLERDGRRITLKVNKG